MTANELDAVRDGIERWDFVNDAVGGVVVNWTEDNTSPDITVLFGVIPGFVGYADCDAGELELDAAAIRTLGSTPAEREWAFNRVAAHEAGHIMGLSHADAAGGWSSGPPVMSTCNDAVDRVFDHDDRAAALHDDHATSYGARYIGSNTGWEEGSLADWGYYNGVTKTLYSGSGAAHGGYYIGVQYPNPVDPPRHCSAVDQLL